MRKVNTRLAKLVRGVIHPVTADDKIPAEILASGDTAIDKYVGVDADGNPVWKTVTGATGSSNGYYPQGW
jgi:hypothetical protein